MRRANVLARAGDLAGVMALYHPDAEWRDLQHAPDTAETAHGRAAILALWTQWLSAFDHFSVELYESRLRPRRARARR